MQTVTLRAVTPADFPTLFEHQRDPGSVRMAEVQPREREAFFAHWDKVVRDPTVTTRIIVVDGRVAGHVGCFERDGKQLVGYWLGRAFWGNGVATRALGQLLALVAHRPLFAHVAKHNVGSTRVLQKCGFVVVRETLEPQTLGQGAFIDLLLKLEA